MFFHKHKWVQVRNVFFKQSNGDDGVYLFCEKCHAVCSVSLKNVPNYNYNKK